jgi:hypothetical protein
MLDRADQIQGIQLGMVFIGGHLIFDPRDDQDAARHAQCQSDDVDKRIALVSLDIP